MQAQSRLQTFTQGLVQQGYTDVTVSRTFLGRSRITATKGNTSREIILSTSGRVLRDDSRVDLNLSSGKDDDKQNNEKARDSKGGDSDDGNDSASDSGNDGGSDDGDNGGHDGGDDGGDDGGGDGEGSGGDGDGDGGDGDK